MDKDDFNEKIGPGHIEPVPHPIGEPVNPYADAIESEEVQAKRLNKPFHLFYKGVGKEVHYASTARAFLFQKRFHNPDHVESFKTYKELLNNL